MYCSKKSRKNIKSILASRKNSPLLMSFTPALFQHPLVTCRALFLDPFIFLAYINDLPEQVRTKFRLFAILIHVSATCQKQTTYQKTSVNSSNGKMPGP